MLHIGTIKRTKYLGRVADRCPVCDDVQPFDVYDNYTIHHVNFLPLDEKLTGATRRCVTCHTRVSCETDAYSSILKDKEARSFAVEDLLQRTNPKLIRRLQQDQAWKGYLRRPLEGDDTAPPRAALERLREKSADDRVAEFLDGLLRWHELTPSDRHQLLLQIDAYVRKHEMRERAAELVWMLAHNAPDGAGCASAIVVSVLGVLVLALSAVLCGSLGISPDDRGLVFFCIMVVMGGVGVVVFERSRRATYRRVFIEKLIEPVEAAGIEVGLVLKALDILEKVKGLPSEVRALLGFRPALIKLLRARGMIRSADDGGSGA